MVCRSSDVPRPLEPKSGLACTEGCLCCAVLCETREEPFERPLPDFVMDRCRTLFLQDRVAVNPQDMGDTADSQTLSEEGELCLRILAKLDAFVHGSDDIRLAQELVRDELPRPNGNSEYDATVSDCRGFGQAPHVADSPLGWRCIQTIHVVDDFRFQWVPLCPVALATSKSCRKRKHQDWATHDVAVVHVPLIRQASAFLQRVLVMGAGELAWATMLEVRTPAISQHGLLAIAFPLQSHSRQSNEGLSCNLGGPSTSPCTSILRHWREPFLFNKGQAPMFARCGCRVLWEEPRRRLAHRLPLDHSKAVFLIDFDSGQRPPE